MIPLRSAALTRSGVETPVGNASVLVEVGCATDGVVTEGVETPVGAASLLVGVGCATDGVVIPLGANTSGSDNVEEPVTEAVGTDGVRSQSQHVRRRDSSRSREFTSRSWMRY